MTVLYWTDYVNKDKYQKDKDDNLRRREDELTRRESIVVDKEICFRELTKLRTIQASALDILKMYTIPSPTSPQPSQQTASETFSPQTVTDVSPIESRSSPIIGSSGLPELVPNKI